jgi:hypothetical protein
MTRPSSRLLAAMAAVGAAIVASLVGGVGVGHAATSFSVQLVPQIGTNANEVHQVSYGYQIGYKLVVQNMDTSNTTHVQVVVKAPTATFKDATDPSCAAAKGDASTMICIPNGGTISAGTTYTIFFRFTAPSSGSSVTATPFVTIAAKTQGNPSNNGTTVAGGSDYAQTVDLSADGSVNDTYIRTVDTDGATAGGPQSFTAKLPNALFGTPFGLELGIHNQTGTAICGTCLPVFTELTIPAASDVLNAGNPFYDPTSSNPYKPYTWTMSATAATSFKLSGVYHVPDPPNDVPVQIPACAIVGGPTASDPVCWDTLTGKNKAGVQYLNASGRGLENGRVGFG